MPESNPFAPDSKLAFLSGLTSSTMDFFKKQHDEQRDEDNRNKEIDYDLLMKAMQAVQKDENLTPSQQRAATQEIMNRSLDILKPKGHQDIKGRLAELFGEGERYEPKGAGNILANASQRPRATIEAPTVTGEGIRPRTVTMPAPPQHELTFREQDLADKERTVGFQLEKELAAIEARDQNVKENIKLRSDEAVKRFQLMLPEKLKGQAEAKLRSKAIEFYGPGQGSTPEALEATAVTLQGEFKRKAEESRRKLAQIDERLKQGEERLKIANAHLGLARQNAAVKQAQIKFNNDPQWKGMWAKAQQSASAAKLLRTQAAIKHMDGDDQEGALLDSKAEGFESDMQRQLDGMQSIEDAVGGRLGGAVSGGVKLPNAPSGGARRGGVKVTVAEIHAEYKDPAVAEKVIQAARRRGVLVQ